jgi:tetratricopeptide (TPR) repeat protein
MSRRTRTAGLFAVALLSLLGFAGLAWAGPEARIIGTVLGPDGKPIAAAKVVITNPKVASFRREVTTDETGEFKILLADSTYTYKYTVSAPGMPETSWDKKAPIGTTQQFEFRFAAAPEAAQAAPVPAQMTPSDKAKVAFNDGVGFLGEGKSAEAEAKLLEATALDPKLAIAWRALTRIAVEKKDGAKAVEYAKKNLALQEADQEAAKALGDEPDAADLLPALQALADAQDLAGDKAAASETRKRMLVASGDPTAAYNDGVGLYNKGKTKEAQAKFEDALKLKPDYAPAHKMLGMIFMSGGRNKDAKTHFQKCVENDKTGKDAEECKAYLGYL